MELIEEGKRYFGTLACSSCGMRILLDEANREMTDNGKYKITCSNLRCKHPTNKYEPTEVEHFLTTESFTTL